MGNSISIGHESLPKPKNPDLLNNLPFQWGDEIGHGVYHVKMPDGWILHDTSKRSDLVNITILNPTGQSVAIIYGKTAEYDFHVNIESSNKKFDLTTGVVKNGYFHDNDSIYEAQVISYDRFCRSVNGMPNSQTECDAEYEKLCIAASALNKDMPHRVILDAKTPLEGAIKSFM